MFTWESICADGLFVLERIKNYITELVHDFIWIIFDIMMECTALVVMGTFQYPQIWWFITKLGGIPKNQWTIELSETSHSTAAMNH